MKTKCFICAKVIKKFPSQIRKYNFCSIVCQGKWQSIYRKKENSSNWKGGKIKRTCQICGRAFRVKPSDIKRRGAKFCSRKCLGIWHSKNLSGENCPLWKGGISQREHRTSAPEWLKIARIIRQRDNFMCQKCGAKSAYCVHHILPWRIWQNDTKTNLITLCRSCHNYVRYYGLEMNDTLWTRIRHFTKSENWGDPYKIKAELVFRLDILREFISHKIIIHCGYETSGHSSKSQHYEGRAADLHIENISLVNQFLLAERFAFSGLGLYPEWSSPGLHCDVRRKGKEEPYNRWARLDGKYVFLNEAVLRRIISGK